MRLMVSVLWICHFSQKERTRNQNDREEMDGFEEVGCELPPFRAILLRNGALRD